jgi:Spy/CpxP family protein refolding chaperone
MKKLLSLLTITAVGLIAAPCITRADDTKTPPTGEGKGHHMDLAERVKMLTEKLSLTQDQQDKVKAIFEKNAPAIKEIVSKGKENITADDKTKLHDIMKSQNEEIAGVLTPEQKTKFEAMHEHGKKPAAPDAAK